jgi:hypothetical protein
VGDAWRAETTANLITADLQDRSAGAAASRAARKAEGGFGLPGGNIQAARHVCQAKARARKTHFVEGAGLKLLA